jgi:hypothetical protein
MPMPSLPYDVTENDWWVSLPLEGMSSRLLFQGVVQQTGYELNTATLDTLLHTVAREQARTCKTCTKRQPSRLFLVLKPEEDARLIATVVCETCADHLQMGVGHPPA